MFIKRGYLFIFIIAFVLVPLSVSAECWKIEHNNGNITKVKSFGYYTKSSGKHLRCSINNVMTTVYTGRIKKMIVNEIHKDHPKGGARGNIILKDGTEGNFDCHEYFPFVSNFGEGNMYWKDVSSITLCGE